MVETLKRLLQLHIRAVLVSLDHVVDLMQPLLQLLSDPGEGVAGVHPPPVVRLERSDVQAGLGGKIDFLHVLYPGDSIIMYCLPS